jgi:hypothetical protein
LDAIGLGTEVGWQQIPIRCKSASIFMVLTVEIAAAQQKWPYNSNNRAFLHDELSPPPSEKVDLPRSARFGAFFWAQYHW